MAGTSKIQWTDATWNPFVGCTMVSPGCANCYAQRQSARLARMAPSARKRGTSAHRLELYQAVVDEHGRFNGQTRLDRAELNRPLSWKRPRRIFVCSMSDLFHGGNDSNEIAAVMDIIASPHCRQHTFIVLTKRPRRCAEWWEWHAEGGVAPTCASAIACEEHGVIPNLWLGVSAEDQRRLDERLPHLLACPAAVKFLSCEPLLGHVIIPTRGIDWVIVGGESGPGARRCKVRWVRSIVDQCRAAQVPVFVKQLGRRIGIDNDSGDEWPRGGDDLIDCEPGRLPMYQGETKAVRTRDPKGGAMVEWPMDLRLREWPK